MERVETFDETGGRASVTLPPQPADRLTAVIVNADARVGGSGHPGDDSMFRLRVRAG